MVQGQKSDYSKTLIYKMVCNDLEIKSGQIVKLTEREIVKLEKKYESDISFKKIGT